MDLNDLIPDNSNSWNINRSYLLFKRCGINIPMCVIEDNCVYVFIDNSALHKPILKLVKHLMKLNVEFYFYPPNYSHPATVIDNNQIIYHYFITYANRYFNDGFDKIGFDFIGNLSKWTKKENCFNLIRENHLKVQKKIQKSWHNHYSRKDEFYYSEYIRDEFNSLYRHILVSQII